MRCCAPPFHRSAPTRGVVRLEEISLEHLDPSSAEQEVERRRAAATQQPFDLECLPLIVWSLYRLSEHEDILLQMEVLTLVLSYERPQSLK